MAYGCPDILDDVPHESTYSRLARTLEGIDLEMAEMAVGVAGDNYLAVASPLQDVSARVLAEHAPPQAALAHDGPDRNSSHHCIHYSIRRTLEEAVADGCHSTGHESRSRRNMDHTNRSFPRIQREETPGIGSKRTGSNRVT